MLLSSLLNPDFIHARSDMASREEVIRHLLHHFQKRSPTVRDVSAIYEAVQKRDALGGTVFPTGIAVPHARLEGFQDLIIGTCAPKNPVSIDGIEVRLFVLMLTSKVASNTYLNALAAFLKMSQDEALFARLVAAKNPLEFIGMVESRGITVRDRVTVADVMDPSVPTISPRAKLRELADMLYRTGAGYAAVVDAEGSFLGEVRLRDLLHVGLPPYTMLMENLRFLESFAPLEALTEKEDTLAVEEIMNKSPARIGPEASIVEAVFELTQKGLDCIPVVDGTRLVGRLCTIDILRRIVRG